MNLTEKKTCIHKHMRTYSNGCVMLTKKNDNLTALQSFSMARCI